MSHFEIKLYRKQGWVDDDPVEVWVAECTNAEAYTAMKGKTPGDAMRRLADEFDVEFIMEPRGNWSDYQDVRIGPEAE